MKKIIFLLFAITTIVNIHLSNLYAEKITHLAAQAESIPKIERFYKENEVEKVKISIPTGCEVEVIPESKGKVYFIDYDNTESIIADIEVLETKGEVVTAKILGRSATIQIEKGHLVRFLIDERRKRISAETRAFEVIHNKITAMTDLCELKSAEKEEIQEFIQEYKDSKHISELERELEKRRVKLKEDDNERFRAVKQEIGQAEQVEKVREISGKFHETYPCSQYSGEVSKYAEQRIETIKKTVADTNIKNLVTPKIAAGYYHSVALKVDGTVWAWGDNKYGQLGDGNFVNSTTPKIIKELVSVVGIAAGRFHTMALKLDGTVWVWGGNGSGQLGDGTMTYKTTPLLVRELSNITAIACGYTHAIALKSDGTVWSWGGNGSGQLGDGTMIDKATPISVHGLSNITAIACGYSHAIALRSDKTVWAWGDNNFGQLGNGTTKNSTKPVPVSGLDNVVAIASGVYHNLAIKSDGTVWAWGENLYGQLGDGTTIDRNVPIQVYSNNMMGIIAIGASYNYSTLLMTDGTVWIIGGMYRPEGRLYEIVTIACGYDHAIALKSDGTVWAWGGNKHGQLGNGTTKDSTIPVQVANINLGKATLSHEVNQREIPKYNNRGPDYLEKGQYDLAISDFNKALEVNPYDVLTYHDRGFAYYKMGQFDLAISDFTKTIEISPRFASAYCNRGNAFCNKGEYDHAISDYSKAIEINPKDAMSYFNRSIAYSKKGKYIEAREDVYKAQNLGYQVHIKYLKDIEKKALAKRDE